MSTDTHHLDTLAETPFDALTMPQIEAIDAELYALTGIGFGYNNYDDWELTINSAAENREDYLRWPIPGLQTVREARALAQALKTAATPR